ncbi:MAG TPA: presqualene diphosphate synthase HpnD [Verrucomicrobiae bacterium]|nr:presqualene diphosphate synthase HpnD [Verrucomicrobiae bacterium]
MQHSRAITRKSASNLALAFILLPREKRDAMSALYAFCREVDDVADDETVPAEKRRAQLAEWRGDVKRACENQLPQIPVNRELQPVFKKFGLRFELFDELIKGCEMDLDRNRYEDFEALEKYCYHVASVVGLLSIEIFGYKNPATRDYAVYLGKALQLTNILRDVKTDAERGRIYLPLDQLRKFGVAPDEIFQSRYSDRFRKLAENIASRAKNFYTFAQKTLPAEDRRSMVAAELMGTVYWKVLEQLEKKDFRVFDQPIRLNKRYKLLLIFLAWTRFGAGSTSPSYGQP